MLGRFVPPLALLISLSAGCSPEPGEGCDPPANAGAFEAGTGEMCFERIEPEGSVPLMAGPQGGYHLWLAIGCTDCGPDVRVRATVSDASTGEEISSTEHFAELVGGEWPQLPGIQISMPGSSWGGEEEEDARVPEGTALTMRVEAVSDEGDAILHEVEIPFVLGDTVSWDPCETNPGSDQCCSGCNG
jgi:hypothetical protein